MNTSSLNLLPSMIPPITSLRYILQHFVPLLQYFLVLTALTPSFLPMNLPALFMPSNPPPFYLKNRPLALSPVVNSAASPPGHYGTKANSNNSTNFISLKCMDLQPNHLPMPSFYVLIGNITSNVMVPVAPATAAMDPPFCSNSPCPCSNILLLC